MGSKSGLGLKFLQWFIRGIQFGCAAVVLGIFSYFLATLRNHSFDIPTWTKAVEGISGAGVLYTIIGLLLLCCLAGHPFTSFIAIFLDICFIGAFIYVAIANKAGASSCQGTVNTPFGSGSGNNQIVSSTDGFTNLPTYRQACKLETAAFSVAIIAAFFFLLSILVELVLVRHRRKEHRFGPSPANNYTSGSGEKKGFMSRFGKKRGTAAHQDNVLPQHSTPNDVRQSYATDTTAVGRDSVAHNKYGESGYGHEGVVGNNGLRGNAVTGTNHAVTGTHHGMTGTNAHATNNTAYGHNNVDTTHYPEHVNGSPLAHDQSAHPPGIVQHAPITHPAGHRYDDGTY